MELDLINILTNDLIQCPDLDSGRDHQLLLWSGIKMNLIGSRLPAQT